MRRGGEADLVVHDDVDRAARLVAAEAREAEALGHDALACKRRVTVQKHRDDARAVMIVELRLLGACLAEDNGVHRLEVRGVRRQRQVDGVAVELAVGRGAEVVLHVARALHVVGLEAAALELVEDRAVGLAHHVGQHRQPAAVGHADHDLLHAQRAAALDDLLHRRDQRLAAVEAEALGAHVLDVQELLEALGLDQLVQDRAPAFPGELDFLAQPLDPLFQPAGLLGVGDVHVLQREGAAIGALHDGQDLAHRRDLQPQHVVEEDRPVHVLLGEAVGLRVELRMRGLVAHPQRVEIGRQVAPDAVGPDDHQRAHRIQHRALDRLVRDGDALLVRLGLDLVACAFRLFGADRPLPVKRRGQLVRGRRRPVGTRPGRALRLGLDRAFVVAERLEELHPGLVDRGGIVRVARVKLFEIRGIVPLHEAGGVEGVVGRLFGHDETSLGFGPHWLGPGWDGRVSHHSTIRGEMARTKNAIISMRPTAPPISAPRSPRMSGSNPPMNPMKMKMPSMTIRG